MTQVEKIGVQFSVIWGIAGLNILGIKENARFTFGIFFVVALVLLTLLASALIDSGAQSWTTIGQSFVMSGQEVGGRGFFGGYGLIIVGIGSCILAYSGIESVVQTAGLVKDWRQIAKAYLFLAVTIGIFTPLISALVLGSGINPAEHETDLITAFASHLNGVPFGLIVGAIASVALIMAVNTAYVASSELIERVGHRYNFGWIIKTNKQQSLYRIHVLSAIFFSLIILVTEGSQNLLAEMYALGLVASFTINMGSLIIYRYGMGTKEIREYNTSRFGTLIVFILLLSSLAYLAMTKPYGLALWVGASVFFLYVGFRVASKRSPELAVLAQTDTPLKMILDLADAPSDTIEIYFKRPQEGVDVVRQEVVFVSFYSPRGGVPARVAPNHYRFALTGQSLFENIRALLYVLKYELPDKKVIVHFGWPLSSWIDRFSTGVMVFSIMKLPKDFPDYTFMLEYFAKKNP
jgi:amino acid transporter